MKMQAYSYYNHIKVLTLIIMACLMVEQGLTARDSVGAAIESFYNRCRNSARRVESACKPLLSRANKGQTIDKTATKTKTCCTRLKQIKASQCSCVLARSNSKFAKSIDSFLTNQTIADACGFENKPVDCTSVNQTFARLMNQASKNTGFLDCNKAMNNIKENCESTVALAKNKTAIPRNLETTVCCGHLFDPSDGIRSCVCKGLAGKKTNADNATVEFFKFATANDLILKRCGNTKYVCLARDLL